jgi:hypothetical protein
MPPAKRRKISPVSEAQDSIAHEDSAGSLTRPTPKELGDQKESPKAEPIAAPATEASAADRNKERQERFKALQARAVR